MVASLPLSTDSDLDVCRARAALTIILSCGVAFHDGATACADLVTCIPSRHIASAGCNSCAKADVPMSDIPSAFSIVDVSRTAARDLPELCALSLSSLLQMQSFRSSRCSLLGSSVCLLLGSICPFGLLPACTRLLRLQSMSCSLSLLTEGRAQTDRLVTSVSAFRRSASMVLDALTVLQQVYARMPGISHTAQLLRDAEGVRRCYMTSVSMRKPCPYVS